MGSSGSAKRPRDARRTTLSASGAANPILGLYLLLMNVCLQLTFSAHDRDLPYHLHGQYDFNAGYGLVLFSRLRIPFVFDGRTLAVY